MLSQIIIPFYIENIADVVGSRRHHYRRRFDSLRDVSCFCCYFMRFGIICKKCCDVVAFRSIALEIYFQRNGNVFFFQSFTWMKQFDCTKSPRFEAHVSSRRNSNVNNSNPTMINKQVWAHAKMLNFFLGFSRSLSNISLRVLCTPYTCVACTNERYFVRNIEKLYRSHFVCCDCGCRDPFAHFCCCGCCYIVVSSSSSSFSVVLFFFGFFLFFARTKLPFRRHITFLLFTNENNVLAPT